MSKTVTKFREKYCCTQNIYSAYSTTFVRNFLVVIIFKELRSRYTQKQRCKVSVIFVQYSTNFGIISCFQVSWNPLNSSWILCLETGSRMEKFLTGSPQNFGHTQKGMWIKRRRKKSEICRKHHKAVKRNFWDLISGFRRVWNSAAWRVA
jgi:hypothetical protein